MRLAGDEHHERQELTHREDANTSGHLAVPQPRERPADICTMHDIGTGYVDWLKTTTFDAYDRACATFVDPPVDDVDHALRLTALLVEALEGYAYGCAMRHIAMTVARWFGDAKGKAVNSRLRRFIHLRRYVHTEDATTLSEQLRRQLCGRIAHLPVRTMIDDTLAFISQSNVLAIAFDSAQRDTLIAERLSHEAAVGWQHLGACLEHAMLPTVSPLWAEWQRRALRQPQPPAPALTSPDYILRIA